MNIPFLESMTHHLGLKLLAFLLALVVYAHVVTEETQEWQLRAPLRISGLPRTLAIEDPPEETVEFSARGTGKQLFRLRVSAPQVVVDLSRVGPGRIQRVLSPADVLLPAGTDVVVTEIRTPAMIALDVDTLLSRTMTAVVTTTGIAPAGLALKGDLTTIPKTVTVTAPSRLIDQAKIAVPPFDLALLSSLQEVRLRIEATPAGVSVDPPFVGIAADVVVVVDRSFTGRPVGIENLPRGLLARLDPPSVDVDLSGPPSLVQALVEDSVRVVLDLAGLESGRHLLVPSIRCSEEDIRVAAIRPPRVLVTLTPASGRQP